MTTIDRRAHFHVGTFLTLVALAGCGGGTTPVDGGPAEAAVDGHVGGDGGGCVVDTDCTDGVFCNGAERCAHGAAGADARGCVAASPASPCLTGQTCDESMRMCITSCGSGGTGDADGDGHRAVSCGGDDCDDSDANRYPGNHEVCDAAMHDEDCDPTTFGFRDGDGDSYADATCCNTDTAGTMHCGDDCNDSRPNVHPALAEVCDGLDNDCNGMVDEGVLITFYPDTDDDGFGDMSAPASATMMACLAPPHFAERHTDCDDTNAAIHPGALEQCDAAMADENCDGVANPASLCSCAGDVTRMCMMLGGVCAAGTERCIGGSWGLCSIEPTPEVCNGLDDNCNGMVDEMLSVTCYPDGDNDGYAAAGALPAQTCPVPGRDGFAGCPPNQTNRPPVGSTGIDCNDANSTISPGATELCDLAMVDENCDGMANPPTLCTCTDGDTRPCTAPGSCGAGNQTCSGGHFSACSVNPVPESCNGVDDNCNGMVDEGLTVTCYADGDNDGFALAGAPAIQSCPVMGRGYVGGCPTGQTNVAPAVGTSDCNDSSAAISPSAVELCDAAMVDENCDGLANPASSCACSGSMSRPCPLGGACAAGTQTCAAGTWGLCSISPVTESCNGLDDNCNGMVDEMLTVTCYADGDNDGYSGAGATGMQRCPDAARMAFGGCPAGTTFRGPGGATLDCDDANPARSPGATETCNGVDDNCNGTVDEGATITCYADADNDGYSPSGSPALQRCSDPTRGGSGGCPLGTTSRAPAAGTTDCNDASPAVSPAATEVCDAAMVDENCDGVANPAALCACSGSGTRPCMSMGACAAGTQTCSSGMWTTCSIGPVAEICNGVDDNCNGMVDESLTIPCTTDADGDGYGTGGASPRCPDVTRPTFGNCPPGYTNVATDCNDANAFVHPGAAEVCNGIDDNCVGGVDEGAQATGCYVDGDSDGYGAGASSTQCRDGTRAGFGFCPVGYTNVGTDCNDANPAIHPGATEVCNGIDDNCAGGIDEALTVSGCLVDTDSDGYGAGGTSTQCRDGTRAAQGFCPIGYTTTAGDCNNAVAAIRPGAPETCNTIDDNCNGMVDEGVLNTYYRDADADSYGLTATTMLACSAPAGYVAASGDCNDARADMHPGAVEVCDGADNDCNGLVDDGALHTYYRDADMDLYGTPGTTTQACSTPGGYVDNSLDCNDANANVRPSATEICNTLDDNCNGMVNEAPAPSYCAASYPLAQHVTSWACGGAGSSCSVGTCAAGYVDCNGTPDDGCEVSTQTSATNCGMCGRVCGVGATCSAGACATITDVYAGGAATCVRWSGGTAACWGSNGTLGALGLLGTGSAAPASSAAPVAATIISNQFRGSLGVHFHCYSTGGGAGTSTFCFGDNSLGEVGDGTFVGPRFDQRFIGTGASRIGAGQVHACMIQGGGVSCWGDNSYGQIGNGVDFGTVPAYGSPQGASVPFGSYTSVAAGFGHSCAVGSGGGVYCWGWGIYGQLGDNNSGGTWHSTLPVTTQVSGGAALAISASNDISAGSYHTCAINQTAGIVYCWGRNADGQVGDGTTALKQQAVVVGAASGWSQVSAGGTFTCGRWGSPSAVYCWGDNAFGQDGPGATPPTDRTTPTFVTLPGGVAATDVATGSSHACALTNASPPTVYCWGRNNFGQLGNFGGDTSTPTLVAGLAPVPP